MNHSSRRLSGTASNAIGSIKVPPRNFDSTRNDPVSMAFELVGAPAFFGFMGFLLDRALGTSPVFALTFAFVAAATTLGLVVWRYNNEMARRDAERRDAQGRRGYRPARWERTTTATVAGNTREDAAQ